MNRTIAGLIGAAALTVLAVGCATTVPAASTPPGGSAPLGASAAAASQVDTNAKLRIGVTSLTPTMDVHKISSAPVGAIGVHMAFEGPGWSQPRGEIEARLAESWAMDGPTTWVFKMRPNVTFHNGEKWDAAAFKWNLERPMDVTKGLAAFQQVASIDTISVVDPMTARVTTKGPQPQLPATIRAVNMMPPAYFQQVGDDGFNSKPVGTGRFKVKEYVPNSKMVLERNDQYWGTPSAIKDVELNILAENTIRSAALRSGDIDIAERVAVGDAQMLKDSGLSIYDFRGGSAQAVFFNTLLDTPVAKRDVRLGMNYGTDKDAIVKAVGQGYGEVVGQLGFPEAFGWNPDIKPYPFDPARAKQLISAAGYPDGFTIKMNVTFGLDTLASPDSAQLMQRTWQRAANVRAEFVTIDVGRYFALYFGGGLEPMFLTTQGLGNDVNGGLARMRFAAEPPPRRIYRNLEFDALMEKVNAEPDRATREKLEQQASKMLHDDAAMIYLTFGSTLTGHVKSVSGMQMNPDGYMEWARIQRLKS